MLTVLSCFSRVRLFATLWTVSHQAPLSMEFSKQEFWSGLPFLSGDLPDPGFKPRVGKSPGGGHGDPPQYSCLENSMDRGAWWDTINGITQSRTRLSH